MVVSTFATRKTPRWKPTNLACNHHHRGDEVDYSANIERIGVRATDSGRSDRVNLEDVVVENNMNGDRSVNCGGPVECSGNSNVGNR